MRAVVLVIVVAAASCEPPALRSGLPPPQQLGTLHAVPPATPPPLDAGADEPVGLPVSADRFERAVRALAASGARDDHVRIVRALRELADALEVRAPQHQADVDAIRRAADELERSPDRSAQHADYVRFGLEAALRVFAAIVPYRGRGLDAYTEVTLRLRRELDRVDPDARLADQHAALVRVFETTADALTLAYGVEATARR